MQSLSLSLRPRTLDEVVGHESVVKAIKDVVARDTVPTGFLFSGPPGTGKTTLAKIVANLIQGDHLPGEEDSFSIEEYNAADLNGVDAVRELVSHADTRPFSGRYRVLILNEAQQFTAPAQNVLLDPMEAKHGSTVYVFTTSAPEKILPALKSRCMSFALKGMRKSEMEELVKRAAAASNVDYDPQFVKMMEACNVSSPREILMCFDKYLAGTPMNELVEHPEKEPLYADVAKALMSGNWTRVSELLSEFKTLPDVKALRSVVGAFLRNSLLREPFGDKAKANAICLTRLGTISAFEDGSVYNSMIAAFYLHCEQIKGGK